MRKVLGSKFYVLGFTILVSVLWFLVTCGYAEEEIGVVQKLWRSLFGKQKVESSAAETTVILDEAKKSPEDKETEESLRRQEEERRGMVKELERQKEERALLENIKRAQDAQRAVQQPPRPPR